MKKPSLILSAALVLGMLPSMVGAQGPDIAPGKLIKGKSSSAVYYVDADLNRYVFANPRVFFSWYEGFEDVVEVEDEDLSSFSLGGNVPYKAGKRLVKLQTDPKVYAVDDGGVLRWVKNERVAKALYGENWNAFVDDLSDAFFANYTVGEDIENEQDFDAMKQALVKSVMQTLGKERAKRFGGDTAHGGWGNRKVALCKGFDDRHHTIYVAQPAVQAHLAKGATLGECNGGAEDDDDTDDASDDTTAPTLRDITVSDITADGATVSFRTNEPTTAKVYYSTVSPVNLTTATSKVVAVSDDSHDIELTGLLADTRYYVVIVAKDAAGNATTASETSFSTAEADITDPVVSDITIDEISEEEATVAFHTNEPTTAKVHYSTASPVNLATAGVEIVAVADDQHEVMLSDLHAETTYYVVIVVEDAAGNETTVAERTFATDSAS